jgi:hypothetical protein
MYDKAGLSIGIDRVRRWPVFALLALLLAIGFTAARHDQALANIDSTARAVARHGGAFVESDSEDRSVPLVPARADWTIESAANLEDVDGIPGLSAGDRATFELRITNGGNVTLTGLAVEGESGSFARAGGDADGDGELDTGEIWTYRASVALAQPVLDRFAGGGTFLFGALIAADQLSSEALAIRLEMSPVAALALRKRLVSVEPGAPNEHHLAFEITARNDGQLTLRRLSITDDLASLAKSAQRLEVLNVTAEGFGGAAANAGFDGVGEPNLLSGDVSLAPGEDGTLRLNILVDTGGAALELANHAVARTDGVPGRTLSHDVTAKGEGGAEATRIALADSDGDYAPDYLEAENADRDGDGISDRRDFDATGYFYCEADGRIMTGGEISIENHTTGGVQSGAGQSHGVVISTDGRSGAYKFHVTQPGRYSLQPTFGGDGAAPSERRPRPPLRGGQAANPFVAGAGVYGDSGRLSDHSAARNPYYLEFDLAPGQPVLFNNNIPLRYCGDPQIALEMDVVEEPQLQRDGRASITYRFELTGAGNERADEVQIRNNLVEVFGAGSYEVAGLRLIEKPAGFSATENPFFDGARNTGLLTSGGALAAGERLVAELTVIANGPRGQYVNSAVADAVGPLRNRRIKPNRASAAAQVPAGAGTSELSIAARTDMAEDGAAEIELRVSNRQPVRLAEAEVVARIPQGFTYVENSARINNTPLSPGNAGADLVWSLPAIEAKGSLTISFMLRPTSRSTPAERLGSFLRDPRNGSIISNLAEAFLPPNPGAQAGCAAVSGTVFRDVNRDGRRQPTERGLPDIRLFLDDGTVVTTNEHGHYTFPCESRQGEGAAVVYLDQSTLPGALVVAGAERRAVSAGDIEGGAYAVVRPAEHRFRLDASSFEQGEVTLDGSALADLGLFLDRLDGEGARLLILYEAPADDSLAEQRVAFVAGLIRQVQASRGAAAPLEIDGRVVERHHR